MVYKFPMFIISVSFYWQAQIVLNVLGLLALIGGSWNHFRGRIASRIETPENESTPLIIRPGNIRLGNDLPMIVLLGGILSCYLIELLGIIANSLIRSGWLDELFVTTQFISLLTWCSLACVLALEKHYTNGLDKIGFVYKCSIVLAIAEIIGCYSGVGGLDLEERFLRILLVINFGRLILVIGFVGISLTKLWSYRSTNNENLTVVNNTDNSEASLFVQLGKVLPYMWPKANIFLQFLVILAFALLIARLVINPLTPKQYKVIIDLLSQETTNQDKSKQIFWQVLLYGVLKWLQGSNGLISSLQSWVLIPITQNVTRSVSIDLFTHLHSLSLEFHTKRKTGEVLRVMDRGTSSIVSLTQYVVFSIFPTIMDIIVALVVIFFEFDVYYSGIILVAMSFYIWATIGITEWRTKFRRTMNEASTKVGGIAVDSLLNFETVKYFAAEEYETKRYANAMEEYLVADRQTSASLPILNLIQNLILTLALLAGSLLCAYEITKGTKTVGSFVFFNAYLLQISVPLNFFGTLYRMIQQNVIDMEKMLNLMEVSQSVSDTQSAKNLQLTKGIVEFDNVCFYYSPDKPALQNISFTVPAGKTVALVGPSGGGKSTIFKLLFRFYEVTDGSIKIDGQDIRDITQNSLRKNVGVVPQDTVLFNDTIAYNIGYGNPLCSQEEIEEVAKKAHIHERIITFPKGYDTVVGERGMRLSGGEKQRVAIARTLLKDPGIVLLDEATSALDITTERQIQASIANMTSDRTTLIIAHRLSTIINADLIICIKEGQVVESGTHQELLALNEGVYKTMWEKQLFEEPIANSSNEEKLNE